MDEVEISSSAIKDYCFDYDEKNDEAHGPSHRNANPKKLVEGIDLKDLFSGNDVVFQINKGYDEKVLEEEDPDVFNEIIYADSKHLKETRGAPPPQCSFEKLSSKMVNVTENGFVKKEIIVSGIGGIVPENSYVTVHYNFYKEYCDLPFDSTYLRNKPEKFRLDYVETIVGLTYAVKTMKKHENSRFFIKWEYAFGELGCPDRIEPKCNIIADVTLVNFIEISDEEVEVNALSENEFFKLDFRKSLNSAKQHHVNGNDDFKKGNLLSSIKSFKKALMVLNDLKMADESEESAVLKQKGKCLVNLALCYNQIGKYEQACLACQDALSIDYKNAKACFHYGRATLGLSNFSASQKWLMRAAKLKPNDPDISLELRKLNDKKGFYDAIDKKFWTKAFENVCSSKSENSEHFKSNK